jgi:hypothetical protein
MRFLLAILLLLGLDLQAANVTNFTLGDRISIGAYISQISSVGSSDWGSPTNNTDGTLPYSWWVADDYTTNGGAYLPDRWTNSLTLTNSHVATRWPFTTESGVNGHKFLTARGTRSYLVNSASEAPATNEVVVAMMTTNHTTITFVFDGAYSTNRLGFLQYPANRWTIDVNDKPSSSVTTNKWIVYSAVFQTNFTRLLTNLTASVYVTNKNVSRKGFTLFNAYNTNSSDYAHKIAEIIVYPAMLTDQQRSNVFVYLTNKYAITP